jgi:predicted transposase/invertase (TIGR01784 family)
VSNDNICKFLAEEYPRDLARWLLGNEPQEVRVIKTELSLKGIQADTVTLLQTNDEILHIEFQTLPPSDPPLPLRMLDSWVRVYRKYRCPVQQFVIFLKETTSDALFSEELLVGNTRHQYHTIRLWEQDPAIFLSNPVLLPFATLARSDTPQQLLEQVGSEVAKIEEENLRINIATATQILAGLRFDHRDLIHLLLGEEMMRESVIYQQIIREGIQIGKQKGRQEGEATVILHLLKRRFGSLDKATKKLILQLPVMSLEALSDVLLDFSNIGDLNIWLAQESSQN